MIQTDLWREQRTWGRPIRRSPTPILAGLIDKHSRRACYVIAKAYGFSGNAAGAFEWLNRAFSAQAKLLTDVKSEPAFRSLHGGPRYSRFFANSNCPVMLIAL